METMESLESTGRVDYNVSVFKEKYQIFGWMKSESNVFGYGIWEAVNVSP